ncbi:MAG TPA: hypothetical protein VMV18_03455 [bacterium]|nr:hypothetical protein [bacterium]
MIRRRHALPLALAAALAVPAIARAVPPASPQEFGQGLVWVPQAVRFPVAPQEVQPAEPFVPRSAGETRGIIEIAPKKAAAFWLDPLDVVRVRVLANKPNALVFYERVVGPPVPPPVPGAPPPAPGSEDAPKGSRLVVDEPGTKDSAGNVLLAEPPGNGSVWMIESTDPVTLTVERPASRTGKLIWDAAEDEVVRWIDDGGALRPLPPGSEELKFQLDADAALAKEILKTTNGARLKEIVAMWRKASALELLERTRPMLRPAFQVEERDGEIPGAGSLVAMSITDPTDPDPRPWRRIAGTTTGYALVVEGPAQLKVEARGILDGRAPDSPPQELRLVDGEVVLARDYFDPGPVRGTDPRTESRAFPEKRPLTDTRGEWVGARESFSIRVPPGKRTYTLTATGGPMLMRVSVGRLRPIAADLTHGMRVRWDEWAKRARAKLDWETSISAEVVRGRVMELVGERASTVPPRLDAMPPLLRADRAASFLVTADAGTLGRELVEDKLSAWLKAADSAPKSLLWSIRLALVRRYGAAGDFGRVRAVLAGADEAPPAPVLAAMAELSPEPLPFENSDSRRLAFEELAWRLAPADETVRTRYQRIWSHTEWSRLTPNEGSTPKNGFPFSPWTWLSLQGRDWDRDDPRPVRSLDAFQSGLTWRIPRGTSRKMQALPSAFDPTQSPILRLFVRTPASDPGPFKVRVNDRTFDGLGVDRLERVEVAVAPGTTPDVQVDGPEGTDAFVSLPPAPGFWPTDPSDYARDIRLRPATFQGAPVRYLLPDPSLPGPLEVTVATLVRGPSGTAGAREGVDLRLRTDQGYARTLTFTPGPPDAGTEAVDAPGPITMPVSFTLALPPGIHAVWIEARSDDIVAGFAIRRPRVYAPTVELAEGTAGGNLLERLASLSRQLAARPTDPWLLVARSNALLDVGEVDYAEQDAIRLAKRETTADAPELEAAEDRLFDRITTGRTPAYLSIKDSPPLPAPVAPGSLALGPVNLAPFMPIARSLRAGDASGALAALDNAPAGPYATWMRARALQEQEKNGPAANLLLSLFLSTGYWQMGLESLPAFRKFAVLEQTRPGDLARIFGAAAMVRERIEHPWARETMLAGSRTSQWTPITDTDGNAGIAQLSMDPGTQLTQPITAIRQAMVATPWPARDARLVMPGNGTGLDLQLASPATLRVEVVCERLRYDDPGDPAPCELSARLDENAPRFVPALPGRSSAVSFTGIAAGRHRVEVYLSKASRAWAASVHFVTEGGGLSASKGNTVTHGRVDVEQQAKVFLARSTRPVTLTVLGPTVLSLEARSSVDAPAATLDVEAKPIAGIEGAPLPKTAATLTREVILDATADPDTRGEDGRDAHVTKAVGSVLLLQDAAVYRVGIRPASGTAFVRLGVREEGRDIDIVDPLAWRQQAGEGKELFHPPRLFTPLGDIPALPRESAPGRFGTVSAQTVGGRESVQDIEGLSTSGPSIVQSELAWHDQLLENALWVQAMGITRAVELNQPSSGFQLDVQATQGGWRAALRGAALQGAYPGKGQISEEDGMFYLDKRFDLGPTTFLLPSLRATAVKQSLDFTDLTPFTPPPDPLLFTGYRAQHDKQIALRTALWLFPTQDILFEVRPGVQSNRDFRSLDNAEMFLDARSLVGIGPVDTRAEASIQSNRWLRDSDRPRAYDSHRFTLDLEPALWAGKTARVSLVARDSFLMFDNAHSPRNAVEFGLRFDLVSGRGLDDLLPLDLDFADLAGHRWWQPAPEEP